MPKDSRNCSCQCRVMASKTPLSHGWESACSGLTERLPYLTPVVVFTPGAKRGIPATVGLT
jgi:hypothetical protein